MHPNKIVQAYIQALLKVVKKVDEANALAQAYKAKFIALNPDLSNSPLTPAQITAVNNFITSINDISTGTVATIVRSKDHPSHGTGALG